MGFAAVDSHIVKFALITRTLHSLPRLNTCRDYSDAALWMESCGREAL